MIALALSQAGETAIIFLLAMLVGAAIVGFGRMGR